MKCPHCGADLGPSIQSEGGTARAAKLTKAERSAIARKGAEARWKDHTPSAKQDKNCLR